MNARLQIVLAEGLIESIRAWISQFGKSREVSGVVHRNRSRLESKNLCPPFHNITYYPNLLK
jgi:hypothetical protein